MQAALQLPEKLLIIALLDRCPAAVGYCHQHAAVYLMDPCTCSCELSGTREPLSKPGSRLHKWLLQALQFYPFVLPKFKPSHQLDISFQKVLFPSHLEKHDFKVIYFYI